MHFDGVFVETSRNKMEIERPSPRTPGMDVSGFICTISTTPSKGASNGSRQPGSAPGTQPARTKRAATNAAMLVIATDNSRCAAIRTPLHPDRIPNWDPGGGNPALDCSALTDSTGLFQLKVTFEGTVSTECNLGRQ
jgi:hypothetical protein